MQLNRKLTKDTKEFFLREFDELKKRYGKADDSERRDLRYFADRFCINFIDSGITDTEFLLDVMHADAIFRHREDFLERGINVDYTRLLPELPDETIHEHYRELASLLTPSFIISNATCTAIESVFTELADDEVDLEEVFKRFVSEGEHPFLFFNRGVFAQHGYSFESLEQKYAHQMTAFA